MYIYIFCDGIDCYWLDFIPQKRIFDNFLEKNMTSNPASALGIASQRSVTPWGGDLRSEASLQERHGGTKCARGALQYSPTRARSRLGDPRRSLP